MSLDFLKPKSPPLIGVDISSSAIKMVELARSGKNFSLERYVIESLPRDSVVDGNITNPDAVSDALKRAYRQLGSRIKGAALALPAVAVITKIIDAPAGQSEDELELMVETEANQYIPFSLDEVNLDFQALDLVPSTPDSIKVLIAAAKKEKVEDRVAAAESIGLKALVVDVESYATQAAFELIQEQLPNKGKDQISAIVDVGATMMHMTMLKNGEQLYFREQAFAGYQLTQEIQRRYNLSYEEAEAAKRAGTLEAGYEDEVLRPYMDNLAIEVARGIQFFLSSTQYHQVDHIILAGGASVIQGLDEIIAGRTQISTMLANPFLSMAQSSRIKPKQLQKDAPALLVACGLAMRRFDE